MLMPKAKILNQIGTYYTPFFLHTLQSALGFPSQRHCLVDNLRSPLVRNCRWPCRIGATQERADGKH